MNELYLSLFVAAVIYIITPGPVFLAIITLVSDRGRFEGLKLISGAIFGCMVWLFLTCLFFIEANRLPYWFFDFLAISCALYLFFLAYRMFMRAKDIAKNKIFERPFRDGLIIGFLNPKSYPVMISVFSALVFSNIENMSWGDFPSIFLFAVMGFAAGYLFVVYTAGIKIIKNFYKEHIKSLSYAFSGIFAYFGLMLLMEIAK